MADYKELLRKAVEALPENNGAARRAVYEKARSALVAQLRGLNPPLPAREITQHRLQLEDCIRQVEQEASDLVISGLKQTEDLPQIAPPPQPAQLAAPAGHTNGAGRQGQLTVNHQHAGNGVASPASRRSAPVPQAAKPSGPPRPPSRLSSKTKPPSASIEDIIAQADDEFPEQEDERPIIPPRRPEIASRGNGTSSQPASGRPAARARRVIEPEPEPEPEPEVEEDLEDDYAPVLPAETGEAPDLEADYDVEDESADDQAPPPVPMPREQEGPVPAGLPSSRPLPAIVARAEAIKAGRGNTAAFAVPANKPYERQRRGPVIEPRREVAQGVGQRAQAVARQQVTYVEPSGAVTNLREVEVPDSANDPQSAIDRAIATLDREARGESAPGAKSTVVEMPQPVRVPQPTPEPAEQTVVPPRRDMPMGAEDGLVRAPVDEDRGGSSAITIFLLIFLVLLIGVGGAAVWAWREGYVDFASMFGKTEPGVQTSAPASATPPAQAPASNNTVANTTSAPTPSEPPAAQLKSDDQPSGTSQVQQAPVTQTPAPTVAPTPPAQEANGPDTGEIKSEDRLTTPAPSAGAENQAPAIAANPAATAGSQSLLLEASDDGTTGAVPFSGTVEWTEGKDETGQPTLVGKANIPARNLGVSVLIRKNSDPTLPASHLMEINFKVSDTFIGGSIAGLPGVLLKNEELVQGSPLVGASARVVGNSFLFALSSAQADIKANVDLLTSRKWIDLAIIYATGKRAIITLEKDEKAQALFTQVFADWAKQGG